MRITFVVAILLFSNLLFSQSSFEKQLHQIIEDTTNHFQSFKSEITVPFDTTTFYSTIKLEGTNDNRVNVQKFICSYSASIDSVTKNEGKRIIKDWKMNVISVLGSGYTEKKIQPSTEFAKGKSRNIDGWSIITDNLSIGVVSAQYDDNKSLYTAVIFISHRHFLPK